MLGMSLLYEKTSTSKVNFVTFQRLEDYPIPRYNGYHNTDRFQNEEGRLYNEFNDRSRLLFYLYPVKRPGGLTPIRCCVCNRNPVGKSYGRYVNRAMVCRYCRKKIR